MRLSARDSSVTPRAARFVVPKIKFRKIPLEVLLAHMVIGADDPAFENSEIPFNRVGMSVAANVFPDGMISRMVMRKVPADAGAAIAAHDPRRLVDLRRQNRPQGLPADTGDVMSRNVSRRAKRGRILSLCQS